MEPGSGAVVQTEISVLIDRQRGGLLTRFRAGPRFDVLVPDFMWEWYDSTLDFSVVECLARDSNYRRYSVETRVQ